MLTLMSQELEAYVQGHTTAEPAIFGRLAAETRESTDCPQMMVGNLEARLLQNIVHISGARRILEIGTFTGYSSLAMALALPADGQLITCDIDEDTTQIARRYWEEAGVASKIDLRPGDARATIASLDGPFDMVFIDADKENYVAYWDLCVPRIRDRGLLLADNVLWGGQVLSPEDDVTRAIVAFNEHVLADKRMTSVMLGIRDGLTLSVKTG